MASSGQEMTAEPVSSAKGRWSEFTQLSRQIKQAGLLDRRRSWYAVRSVSIWPCWSPDGSPS